MPEWLQYFDVGQRTAILGLLVYLWIMVRQLRADFEDRMCRVEDVLMRAPNRKRYAKGAE